MNFKEKIANLIEKSLQANGFETSTNDILLGVETPKDKTNGDFSSHVLDYQRH